MNRLACLFLSISVMTLSVGCQKQASDIRASGEQAIRAADAEWLKAMRAKDLDLVVSFYADDATVFPIAEPIANTKEAIRKYWAHTLGIPGIQITWQITKIDVARAGDIAYVQGTSKATFEDPKGKPSAEIGKWVMVWKKQPNGVWKAVVEISNTDSPPPAHAASTHTS
jgi:uncharacterized protein (TIGR02246 family)